MLPYTEPLQQSAGQQQQLLRQRLEEQHGLLLQQGTSVQQLQTSDAAKLQEQQQRYDDAQYVLLPRGGDSQQTLQQGGPQLQSHEKPQQQPSPEDEPWQQRELSREQQQSGQPQVNDGHRQMRQQVHQQEAGVEQQLVQQYLSALKSEGKEPLLQQVGEFLCRWQQRQQQQQPPEANPKQSVAPEGLEHQLSQSQTHQQQVQQFLLQHLDRQQLLHASQQPGQQPQLRSLMPQQLPLLQQQGEGGLHLDTFVLKQQSPSRQQPRPQHEQRSEAHRARKKLRTPSHGSPTPRASAVASPTDAAQQQQQQQREELPPPLKKQACREHQQPARRRQPLQQHEKEVDLKRRITPSSPAAALLCGSTHKTQDAAAVAVAGEAAVAGDVATLAEDAAAAPAVTAAADAAGASPQQLQQRKRGVRSSNSSKTSRGMQQRQQQRRQQQRPPRQHRQQQQQRQQRQQQRQQVARGSPSPTRGRPGGQRFDFFKSSTYSSTNVPAVAGGETAAGFAERKGSTGGGRPLWSPEGGSGAGSCSSTAPGSGVLVQQQTPQRVQQQQLALLQQHQHPHDQHARHGTYGIVARGVRERLTSRTDADSAATAAAGAGEAGDSSTSSSASTAAGGRRGKHCRTALLQNMRGDRPYVCLSCKYRDPFLTLSPDQLEVTGHKGWSSVLATHCAEKGRWYFEVEILRSETNKLRFQGYSPDAPPPPIHARWRIGWACRYQKYDIPIGCNQFSFALTETSEGLQLVAEGLKRPLPAAAGGGSGSSAEPTHTKDKDIIGCFLELQEPKSWQPDPRKDHKLYEFLQAGILCNPEAPPPLVIDEGAWIEFSVNGRRLGRVFQKEIGSGAYHPSLSLYMGAKLRFNPGPEFAFPPDVSERFQACSGMRRPYIL